MDGERVLVVQTGLDRGRVVVLRGDVVMIGRARESDLQLRDDGVSRVHARVVRDGDAWRLEDAGGAVALVMRGERVQRHVLADGDTFQVGPVARVTVARYTAALGAEQRAIAEAARVDPVTGALAKHALADLLRAAWDAAALPRATPACLLVVHAAQVGAEVGGNGPGTSDDVRRSLSRVLRKASRPHDALGLVDVDELAIFCPDTTEAEALVHASALCAAVAAYPFEHRRERVTLTVSIGVALLDRDTQPLPRDWVWGARARMESARASGRNRIVGAAGAHSDPARSDEPAPGEGPAPRRVRGGSEEP